MGAQALKCQWGNPELTPWDNHFKSKVPRAFSTRMTPYRSSKNKRKSRRGNRWAFSLMSLLRKTIITFLPLMSNNTSKQAFHPWFAPNWYLSCAQKSVLVHKSSMSVVERAMLAYISRRRDSWIYMESTAAKTYFSRLNKKGAISNLADSCLVRVRYRSLTSTSANTTSSL